MTDAPPDAPSPAGFAYTGVENLEIMAVAVNYTAFLTGLITAELKPGDAVLDFGAGAGLLARRIGAAGYRLACVEPDAALRDRLSAAGLPSHETLDAIPHGSLDLIYTFNVLEHIEDDLGAVAQLRDRLRPGGKLLIYVPAFPCLFSSMDRKVGHVRRYRRRGLAAVLAGAGLRIGRIAYQEGLGFFASLAFKLVGSADGTINKTALIAYDRWIFPLSRPLDRLTGRWFGKNLVALARRP
jgi:SAM-dependent methyltransferase